MSDFSLFSLFTAGLALFAPLSAAYTQPTGNAPKGNPISQPGLMSVVPAGKPFTVTWEPTTKGTVTLVLLKGPSTDAEPQYAIVEKIENDGSYVWTPKTDLEPTDGAEGYGIQLIVDSDGQYQYTTQFGISNPNYKPDAETTSEVAKPTTSASPSTSSETASWTSHGGHGGWGHGHGGYGHGGHNVHSGYTHPSMPSGTGSAHTTMTTSQSNSTSSGHWATQNVTMVLPTGGATTSKPAHTSAHTAPTYGSGTGSAPTNSTPSAPVATGNGASSSVASIGGLVLAAGALMFAL